MDLCGPSRTSVGQFSRMTWVAFLKYKSEALEKFKIFKALAESQTGCKLKCIRLDRGGEFTDYDFADLCNEHGIKQQFTIAGTPQQNGVVERKSRSVQQISRAMMQESNIPQTYWVEAVHIVVHILNKAHLRQNCDKTPYELWHGKLASIKHFRVFGSKCFIKNNDEKLGKFDARADEGIFLVYASKSKGYRCYNKRLHKIVESIDVIFDEDLPNRTRSTRCSNPPDNHEDENQDNDELSKATKDTELNSKCP